MALGVWMLGLAFRRILLLVYTLHTIVDKAQPEQYV